MNSKRQEKNSNKPCEQQEYTTMEKRLMKILDDYYGDGRDYAYKKEICEFIEVRAEDIKQIISDYSDLFVS